MFVFQSFNIYIKNYTVPWVHAFALKLNIQVFLYFRTNHIFDFGQELIFSHIALRINKHHKTFLIRSVYAFGSDIDLGLGGVVDPNGFCDVIF